QVTLALLNVRLFGLIVAPVGLELQDVFQLGHSSSLTLCLPVALTPAASAMAWSLAFPRRLPWSFSEDIDLPSVMSICLRFFAIALLFGSTYLPSLTLGGIVMAGATFTLLIGCESLAACRQRDESRVWLAEIFAGASLEFFAMFHVIEFGRGIAIFVVLGAGLLMWLVGRL